MREGVVIVRLKPHIPVLRSGFYRLEDIGQVWCDARHVFVQRLLLNVPQAGMDYQAADIAALIQRHVPVRVEFIGCLCTRVLSRPALMWERMQDWMLRLGGYDDHER